MKRSETKQNEKIGSETKNFWKPNKAKLRCTNFASVGSEKFEAKRSKKTFFFRECAKRISFRFVSLWSEKFFFRNRRTLLLASNVSYHHSPLATFYRMRGVAFPSKIILTLTLPSQSWSCWLWRQIAEILLMYIIFYNYLFSQKHFAYVFKQHTKCPKMMFLDTFNEFTIKSSRSITLSPIDSTTRRQEHSQYNSVCCLAPCELTFQSPSGPVPSRVRRMALGPLSGSFWVNQWRHAALGQFLNHRALWNT